MVGTYQMQSAAGELFDVEIPAFSLDLPGMARTLN
jgi:ApaG protein